MRKSIGLTTLSSETTSSTETEVERHEGNSQRRSKCVAGQAGDRAKARGMGSHLKQGLVSYKFIEEVAQRFLSCRHYVNINS